MSSLKPFQIAPLSDTGRQPAGYCVAEAPCQVICVCGGYGFPTGNASAARITVVGKALQLAGISFLLLHCGPSPDAINTQRSGIYNGINFEYTTPVKRPRNSIARWLLYLRGLGALTIRLGRLKSVQPRPVVYLYVMDGVLNLYVGILCRLLGIPVVQELCEWLPGEPTCSRFTKWLYSKPIFSSATGALVISKAIEQRVRTISATVNPRLLIHRLPAIVDSRRFAGATGYFPSDSVPHFVYCGTWMGDIFFLIRALAIVKHSGHRCKLKIIGGCTEVSRPEILNYSREQGLDPDDVVLAGCVDDRTLELSYRSATALLLPLWDDDRSKTRLPNKLSEYLASGRPVVTCEIGDLTEFLTDDVSAHFGRPGDEREFADRMIAVLRNPERATQIGLAGQRECFSRLDYRSHVEGLGKFFVDCLELRK